LISPAEITRIVKSNNIQSKFLINLRSNMNAKKNSPCYDLRYQINILAFEIGF